MGRPVLLLSAVVGTAGHAIMNAPLPRVGSGGSPGLTAAEILSLDGADNARNVAGNGCTGANGNTNGWTSFNPPPRANDPSLLPLQVYEPGQNLDIEWNLVVPHADDTLLTGIRVAIHYGDRDSFNDNVLLGCLSGDSGCDEQNSRGIYQNRVPADAGGQGALRQSRQTSLPLGKTCDYCVLQFVWPVKAGAVDAFYMSCADISIRTKDADGNFLPGGVIVETDDNNNLLPDGKASTDAGGNALGGGGGGGGGGDAGVAIGVILAIVVVGGLGYYFYKNGCRGVSVPKLSSGTGGGAGKLADGWVAATDPSSGRTYYVNKTTQQTTWEMPTKAPGGPPPMQQLGVSLPPGWQSATDPASGRRGVAHPTIRATGQMIIGGGCTITHTEPLHARLAGLTTSTASPAPHRGRFRLCDAHAQRAQARPAGGARGGKATRRRATMRRCVRVQEPSRALVVRDAA